MSFPVIDHISTETTSTSITALWDVTIDKRTVRFRVFAEDGFTSYTPLNNPTGYRPFEDVLCAHIEANRLMRVRL